MQTSKRLFIHLNLIAAVLIAAVTGSAQATALVPLPVYVVSATRSPAAITTTGSYVDSISAVDLIRSQQPDLRSALGLVPGLSVSSSGAPGAISSLFLRGANSSQTLFLVDGIRLNDANTDYQVYLGGANTSPVDNIEVAHGPQSTLYGSEAVGGVISLNAQPGVGRPTARVFVEAGSFGTVQGAVSSQGAIGNTAYNYSVSGGTTQNQRENNDFNHTTAVLRLDHRFSDQVAIGGTYRGFLSEYGSPGAIAGFGANDPDNYSKERNHLGTVFLLYTPSVVFSSKLTVGGQLRRFESVEPDPSGDVNTVTKNSRAVLDWQNVVNVYEHHRITAGLTAERNWTTSNGFGQIDRRQDLLAFFVQDEYSPFKQVYITAGLRNDDFDTFGRATTGRATAAWLSTNSRWKVRGSYGTAFRAPSLIDLYGQESYYVGNPNLHPEKARGWDVGVDYYLPANRGSVSATWFSTSYRDLINYDFSGFPGTTVNVDRARTNGLELATKLSLPGSFELRAAYTYLQADNLADGSRLLRRPRNTGTVDVWHAFNSAFSLGAGAAFVSDQYDVDAASFATIKAEDYTVARLYATWQGEKHLAIKARIENLLNEKYSAVNGYPQPGLGVFAGVEYRF